MFTMKDFITKEEQAVMQAMVVGVEKDGKVVRATMQIEDGSVKGINEMLHSSRVGRSESALKDFNAIKRERELATMKKDKESKGKL